MPRAPEPSYRRPSKRKPQRSTAFGPLKRADAPLKTAQHVARRRVERAQRNLPERPLPAIPVLAHPTQRQAEHAVRLANRAVKRIAAPQRGELRQDPRSRAKLAGAVHAQRTLEHNVQVRLGMAAIRANPGAFGLEPKDVHGLHRAAAANKIPEATRNQLAAIGRGAQATRISQAKPGHQTRVGVSGLATINATALRKNLIAATHLDAGDAPTRLVRSALGDVKTLGEAPFVGGLQVAQGTADLLTRGDTSRLGALAKGVAAGIKEEVTHPGRAFREHPLLTALDVAGVGSVVGRTAGAVARGTTAGRVGSTVRPPLALVDDAGNRVLQPRSYSKDLIRRGVQQAADARRQAVNDLKGRPVTVADRGRQVSVLRASEGEAARHLRRRGNFVASRANSAERLAREVAGKEGEVRRGRKGVRGKRARDLAAMVTEGTVLTGRSFQRDLEAHAERLAREHEARKDTGGYRHSAEEQAALNRIQTVRTALRDPKLMAQAERIAEAGIAHGSRLHKGDRELMAREVLSEESGTRAPLITVAVEHMGARHFTEREHRALERSAMQAERAAAERARTATGPTREQALRDFHAARAERIAVSGRHPERVKVHEEARGRVSKAEAQVKKARSEQLQADRAVARLGGAQAVQRGGTAAERMAVAQRGGRRSQNVLDYIDRQMADEPRLARGAAKERQMAAKREAVLKRARTAKANRQRAEKALRKERHRLRENPLPDIRAGVRTAEGRHLSNRDIENFLRSKGRDPETIGFLPHILPRDAETFGKRAHHTQLRAGSRPDLDSGPSRTGEAYRKGATEASAELLKNQGVRQATLLTKARHLDDLVTEHGLRHPAWGKAQRGEQLTRAEQRAVDRGGYFTPREADELADRIATDTRDIRIDEKTGHTVIRTKGGQELVPVRAHSGRLDAETQRLIRENLQGPAAMETLPQRLLNDRILSPDDLAKGRTRNVVLVPKALIDQLDKHLRPAGELERFLQLLNRPFRMAVLPQPRWLTGNFVEPYFVRLPGIGSGMVNLPGMALDMVAAGKAVRRLERSGNPRLVALAHDIRAQQFGGLFIGSRGASNRRTRDEFETYSRIAAKVPAVEQLGDLGARILKVGLKPLEAFFTFNRAAIEGPVQRAAFGRQLRRDIQEFTGNWFETIKLGNRAVDEASRGLLDTATQRRFMAMQHELLGQYEGYGPRVRALIQGPAPFLPWAMSAARFVYWTMPMHRTAQTALLIKTQDVTAKAWADEHKDAPPGGLRLASRTAKGGFVDLARYTPYGLTGPVAEGDPQGVTDQFLPQLSGAVAAASGTDPFGRPLQVKRTASNPEGKPSGKQKTGIALYGLAEALVPYLSTARRLQEHGETPFAGSTVLHPSTKPGTSHGMSAARRTFDPFRPTYLRTGGGKAAKGGAPKGNYWQRTAVETGAHSADALPDEDYWRSLAAGK